MTEFETELSERLATCERLLNKYLKISEKLERAKNSPDSNEEIYRLFSENVVHELDYVSQDTLKYLETYYGERLNERNTGN